MKLGNLFWKLFAAFALLSLVTVTLFGVLAIPALTEREEEQTAHSLRTVLGLLEEWARPVLEGDAPGAALQERFLTLRDPLLRLTVVAPDGRVIADTDYEPEVMGDHGDRPELVQARQTGSGRSERLSATLGTRMLYVARRVDQPGGVLGFVRAAQRLGAVDARKRRLARVLVAAAAGALLAGLAAAFFVSRRLTRPIRAIAEAALAVSHGDYRREVPVEGRDEVGRLARTFNRMAHELRERVDTISRDRTELLAILSAMAEGVVAVDDDERIVLINDAAGQLLGVDPGAAIGRRVWEVTRQKEVGEVLKGAVGKGRRTEQETQVTASPRDRHLQLLAAPVREPGGDLHGAVLVLHDISKLRHLEKVRRDFVANVSHELKTPLAAIRGFAETILEDPNMDAETRAHFVERIRRQTLRLADLVDEVLALSRLEAQEPGIVQTTVEVAPAVREAIQSLQPLARERSIALTQSIPEETLRIRGDAEGLRRIVSNLLDNALKYTPREGEVWVRVEDHASHVRILVEDTGIGIPSDARTRVFERFYRVDPGRSRAAGGTGLGLSIVKHLVQNVAGRVRVEAREGGGSRFVVELPKAEGRPPQDA